MAKVNLDNLKEEALATAGKVADKCVELAKTAGEKAKMAGQIAKLRTEIVMEKDIAKKAYCEIGKLYYEKHKSNPDPDMAQAVTECSLSLEIIERKQTELQMLKKQLVEDFGPAAEDLEDVFEDVAEKAGDVVESVVETMTDEE